MVKRFMVKRFYHEKSLYGRHVSDIMGEHPKLGRKNAEDLAIGRMHRSEAQKKRYRKEKRNQTPMNFNISGFKMPSFKF